MADRLTSGNMLVGSFTGTGQSGEINVTNAGQLNLDFGSGSVTLQRQGFGDRWHDCVDGTFTADTAVNIEGRGAKFRLNCTSWVSEIFYSIVG